MGEVPEPFTADEIRRLEDGLPDLAQWGKYLLVPFLVRRLRYPEVLWINERWFFERGFDIQEDLTRQRVHHWLVEEFAFTVQDIRDPEESYGNDCRNIGADRYGSTTATSAHGGSGRVGVVGRFQVKGVGVTPLVGPGTAWVHAHGAVGLEEALAEAAIGEVVGAEFPHGGVSVIAVIDTGLYEHLPPPASGPGGRRALIIRPAALRPAHFERAPYFVESVSGYQNDPAEDVRRVRDAISYFQTIPTAQRQSLNLPVDVFELAVRLAEQAAFGDAHRLFSGGFFSSNLTLNGALLDYGVMRSLPTWQRITVHAHAPGFGADAHVLKAVLRSLAFYLNRNPSRNLPLVAIDDLLAKVDQAYRDHLHQNLSAFFGNIEGDDPKLIQQIGDILLNYFRMQQKTRFRFDWKKPLDTDAPWLGAAMQAHCSSGSTESMEHQVLRSIEVLFRQSSGMSEDWQARFALAWATAMRYLSPRCLTREALRDALYATAISSDRTVRPNAADAMKTVTDIVGRARRHWPHLPAYLQVRAQTCASGSSALWCLRYPDGHWMLWIEGIRTSTTMYFFDGRWPSNSPDLFDIHRTLHSWSATLPVESDVLDFNAEVDLLVFGQRVRIPPMQYIYPKSFLRDSQI